MKTKEKKLELAQQKLRLLSFQVNGNMPKYIPETEEGCKLAIINLNKVKLSRIKQQ